MRTQRYETDLTDEQFALIEPFLPRRKRTGRPPADLREVLNAILYLVRTGCPWRLLPHDFPPWSTVHTWYRRWRKDGTWEHTHEALRQQVRAAAGRHPSPRASAADSQSVKTTPSGGGAQGCDNGKKVLGRKRHLWVDSLGLVLAVLVTAADVHDSRAGCACGRMAARPGRGSPDPDDQLAGVLRAGRGSLSPAHRPVPGGGVEPGRSRGCGLGRAAGRGEAPGHTPH
jgi:transposase